MCPRLWHPEAGPGLGLPTGHVVGGVRDPTPQAEERVRTFRKPPSSVLSPPPPRPGQGVAWCPTSFTDQGLGLPLIEVLRQSRP